MYILMRLYIEMSNRKYLLDRDKKLDKGWYPIPFLDEKDGICTVNFLGYTMFVIVLSTAMALIAQIQPLWQRP